MDYDFSGYATKNDLLCADGRVIRHDAFKDNDGQVVPLVWQHVHDDPMNVLGHALLENRDDGVYAYAKFNDTPSGKHAKQMVQNGDIVSMSIYANRLKQNGNDVVHGIIREVSLVLAGANPGALIDNISFAHADGSFTNVDDEAVIYSGLENIAVLSHADDTDEEDDMANSDDMTVQDVFDTLTDDQKDAVYFLIGQALQEQEDEFEHADMADPSVQDVLDTLNDEQRDAVMFLIDQAIDDADSFEHADDDDDDEDYDDEDYDDEDYDDEDYDEDEDEDDYDEDEDYDDADDDEDYDEDDDVEHSALYGGTFMKHNVFDDVYEDDMDILTHDEFDAIMEDAYKSNSLKDVFLQHGITNLDILFPEAQMVRPDPDMVTRNMGWVDVLWNSVKRTPFARIKSIYANLTADAARAKGYVKGNKKVDQVLALLGRETTPQTIYKKQTIDRDDMIDITSIDVIAWIKQDLRMMLNEELCRAILVGDGRDILSQDKIKPDRIRPIYQDDDVYTIHYPVTFGANDTDDQKSSKIIDSASRARKNYKGSGSPKMFATNEVITDMLLAKDTLGRRLYKDEAELKAALRVSDIIEVPVMEGVTRTTGEGANAKTFALLALIFNPIDYTVGADKGGAVSLFDDFDIDYNQMKYLIETRCSGALTIPYSAIALETDAANVNP